MNKKRNWEWILSRIFLIISAVSLGMGMLLLASNVGANIRPDGLPQDTIWPYFLIGAIMVLLGVGLDTDLDRRE